MPSCRRQRVSSAELILSSTNSQNTSFLITGTWKPFKEQHVLKLQL